MKAVTQSAFPQEVYNPKAYLNPYGEQKTMRSANAPAITVNSLHGARVEKRKQQIRDQIRGFQSAKNGER